MRTPECVSGFHLTEAERTILFTQAYMEYQAEHCLGALAAPFADICLGIIQHIRSLHGWPPYRPRRLKKSEDPDFLSRLHDILLLYLDPPLDAVVVGLDEMSQIPIGRRCDQDIIGRRTTTVYAAINLRDGRVIVPAKDDPLETGDELLFVTSEDVEDDLATLLSGGHH